jgi:anti-sigma factor RsiW
MMQPRDHAVAEALAYVDDCLPPNRRGDFERMMAADPELADRVSIWRAQNAAIRAAFADGAARRALAIGRESFPRTSDPGRAARFVEELRRGARSGEQLDGPAASREAPVARAKTWHGLGVGRRLARAMVVLAAAVFVCVVSAGLGAGDRAKHFADAAFAAFRAYAGQRARSVEVATSDVTALEKWLRPQLASPVIVPALDGAGFVLVGGRVTPGAESAAAFVLYQNAEGERLALTIEPGESPPAREPLIVAAGDTLAASFSARGPATLTIVGRVGTARLTEIARVATATRTSP